MYMNNNNNNNNNNKQKIKITTTVFSQRNSIIHEEYAKLPNSFGTGRGKDAQ